MICPECLSRDLKEIKFDAQKQDITYKCNDCGYEFVVSVIPDDKLKPELSYAR